VIVIDIINLAVFQLKVMWCTAGPRKHTYRYS